MNSSGPTRCLLDQRFQHRRVIVRRGRIPPPIFLDDAHGGERLAAVEGRYYVPNNGLPQRTRRDCILHCGHWVPPFRKRGKDPSSNALGRSASEALVRPANRPRYAARPWSCSAAAMTFDGSSVEGFAYRQLRQNVKAGTKAAGRIVPACIHPSAGVRQAQAGGRSPSLIVLPPAFSNAAPGRERSL